VLKEAHLGDGFVGCSEFKKFVRLKSSQFGFGKRLINGTRKVPIQNRINTALKVVDVREINNQ
jgi:hypothetical protein